MLPTGQRGGEAKNNPQEVHETHKSKKITHLREDNSEIKPGPPRWGFSIGLVIHFCKECGTQNPQKRTRTDNKMTSNAKQKDKRNGVAENWNIAVWNVRGISHT
jgi:hypothetical protein